MRQKLANNILNLAPVIQSLLLTASKKVTKSVSNNTVALLSASQEKETKNVSLYAKMASRCS